MVDLLAHYAGTQPDKPAVIDDRPGRPVLTLGFAELNRRANQLGHLLLALGVNESTKVVWCGQNSADLFPRSTPSARSARWRSAQLPPCRRRGGLRHRQLRRPGRVRRCGVPGLITGIRARVPKVTDVLVFGGDGELERRAAAMPDGSPGAPTAPSAGATMIYTSGTTGRPKGAVREASLERRLPSRCCSSSATCPKTCT